MNGAAQKAKTITQYWKLIKYFIHQVKVTPFDKQFTNSYLDNDFHILYVSFNTDMIST